MKNILKNDTALLIIGHVLFIIAILGIIIGEIE